jgi:hypothetical protein
MKNGPKKLLTLGGETLMVKIVVPAAFIVSAYPFATAKWSLSGTPSVIKTTTGATFLLREENNTPF